MALGEATTIRVSKSTLEILERLREKLKAGSLDEAIQDLIKQRRKMLVDEVFSLDKGRIRPFTEEDRGEDRN